MKVYVIRKCFMYDGDEVVAVCSTLEKAKEKREQIIKEDKKDRIFADAYDIDEFVVDE